MDLSWCPVCDRQIFAVDSLYCSEKCQRQDAISLPNPSSFSNYTFPKRHSPHASPYATPYASPIGSPLSSPMLYSTRRYDYFEACDDLTASPEDLLLSSRYDRGIHNTLNAGEKDEGINDDGMSLTVVHTSTVVTASTTTFTTITVETREVQQPVPVVKKKRSLVENAWRMLFK